MRTNQRKLMCIVMRFYTQGDLKRRMSEFHPIEGLEQ
jgi:hypothetical protein